ncbi:MAG: GNAT family N-acetyltransferase [Ilumatobacteraceae bacterium]
MSELQLRPMTADDLDDIAELVAAAYRHDGVPQVLTVDELAEELDDDHVVYATDTRVALWGDRVAGYVYTYHLPSEVREERCYIFGEVLPELRRRGVGAALMEWAIPRAEVQLRSSGRSLPRYVRTDRYDYIVGAHSLFAHVGMQPVRYMEELLRPLNDLPAVPEVAGARIVPWPEGRDDEIRTAKNTAFADHWGSTPTSEHHWQQMVRGHGGRPDLSFIALDEDDRVVAHCLNKRFPDDDELIGRRDAWIDNLGTLPEWRGRGLASALVAASLHAFAADGCTHASIGVDSENPSGAAQLYRRLGFEPRQRSITHELVVP